MSRTIIPFPYWSIELTANFPFISIFNNHDEEMKRINKQFSDLNQKVTDLEEKLEQKTSEKKELISEYSNPPLYTANSTENDKEPASTEDK